jgi:amino acid adenylation domain-containing protein
VSTSSELYNLAAPFLARAVAAPDRTALRIGAKVISYGRLADEAGRIAAWLLQGEEGRVGVLARGSVRAYAAILGACLAGRAYVPLGVDLPGERLVDLVRRAGLCALVTDRAVDPRLRDAAPLRILEPGGAGLRAIAPIGAPTAVAPGSVSYVIFTSGTTGQPKAVLVPAGAVRHCLAAERERYSFQEDDRVSQFYELNFDPSVWEIFMTLGAGASLHVVGPAQRMAPGRFIAGERLTVWSSVPSVIGFMLRTKQLRPGAFPSLRYSMFGGEPLPVAAAEAWRDAAPNSALDNQYGPTEATVACTGEWVGTPPRVTPSRQTVAIGRPFSGMSVAIVDEGHRFLPAGEVGELAVSGPQLAIGYDDAALTARRFPVLDHPTLGSRRRYLTGDLAYEDPDGHLHHLGRIDNQVKVVGRRVELEEIEAHLRAVSGVDAAVVPWPVEDGVASGVVAVLAQGAWSVEAVQRAMVRRVPSYMVPKRIVALASLPLSTNGKLDRHALARHVEAAGGDHA